MAELLYAKVIKFLGNTVDPLISELNYSIRLSDYLTTFDLINSFPEKNVNCHYTYGGCQKPYVK